MTDTPHNNDSQPHYTRNGWTHKNLANHEQTIINDLRRQLADKDQLITDACEAEDAARKLLAAYDYSSPDCYEPITALVERVMAELYTCEQSLDTAWRDVLLERMFVRELRDAIDTVEAATKPNTPLVEVLLAVVECINTNNRLKGEAAKGATNGTKA